MPRVLSICSENSARSQMAEVCFNHLSREWRADSAGTQPGSRVNPLAVQAMAEIGIDMASASSKALDPSRLDDYSRIISFGCIVKSVFPARERLEEWLLEDPGKGDMCLMRDTRDEIIRLVSQLVVEVEGGPL